MKISSKQVTVYTISGIPSLDPINFILEDFDIGRGRIIVECYGQAWSYCWSAMANLKLADFLMQCDDEYIAMKLLHFGRKVEKKDELYVLRIVNAIKTALQSLREQESNESK